MLGSSDHEVSFSAANVSKCVERTGTRVHLNILKVTVRFQLLHLPKVVLTHRCVSFLTVDQVVSPHLTRRRDVRSSLAPCCGARSSRRAGPSRQRGSRSGTSRARAPSPAPAAAPAAPNHAIKARLKRQARCRRE